MEVHNLKINYLPTYWSQSDEPTRLDILLKPKLVWTSLLPKGSSRFMSHKLLYI